MLMASKGQNGMPLRGFTVSRAELRHLLDRLRKMPLKLRTSVPGLSPDRADIIVAGLAIVDRVMDRFGVNSVQIHNRGVRDGLLLTMIDRALGESLEKPPDKDAALDRLAASCGVEMAHGRRVARLAGSIYAQLAPHYDLNPDDRALLEAAARLQDVGYLIDYDQHHKHSYHLILHSRLEGFQRGELELIANVARYHRGAAPKRRHANFRQLSRGDRRRVRSLAAILRLAGGLDRSNTRQVTDVTVEFPRKRTIALKLAAAQYPEVDIWGARKRAKLFEKVFAARLRIEWAHADRPPAEPGPNGSPQSHEAPAPEKAGG
jgi:exopolyphosphatase/guanosine-5'-triphosphate,3'-diphosphate pyrophosphatase